jgi:hypothetical protein
MLMTHASVIHTGVLTSPGLKKKGNRNRITEVCFDGLGHSVAVLVFNDYAKRDRFLNRLGYFENAVGRIQIPHLSGQQWVKRPQLPCKGNQSLPCPIFEG